MGYRCVLSCRGDSKKTSLFIYYVENTEKIEHSDLHVDLEPLKHAQWVICVEIMEMRSQWDVFQLCINSLAVWNQRLNQLSGWQVSDDRAGEEASCGGPRTGVVTPGLPLWFWLDILANSLKQQWRWFGVMRWTFFLMTFKVCEWYAEQPKAHLCINLLFNQYLKYIKKSTAICVGWNPRLFLRVYFLS